jgi:alpha-ribazole phosphatase
MVFASPMNRCIQTAGIIYPGKPICIIDDFRECDFGDFEGYNYDELKDNPAYQAWLASGGELPFPRGESRMEFSERCVKAFESSAAHLSEGNYAFIVHGGTIMAVMEYFTNGSYYDYQVRNGKGFILNADGSYEVL